MNTSAAVAKGGVPKAVWWALGLAVAALVLIVTVLTLKPAGLFGKHVVTRV